MKLLLVCVCLLGCSKKTEPPPPGPPPYTLVVVYSGWEMWIGNDKVAKLPADDPSKMPGALVALTAAFDKLDLAHTAPAGSQIMAISYSDKPTVRVPMGPISAFSGKVFGKQDDYFGSVGVELVHALEIATVELGKPKTGKTVILVIGDGADTDPDAAHTRLPVLKQELAAKHVDVVGFVYKAPLSGDVNVLKWLTDDVHVVASLDHLDTELAHALERYQR